MSESTSEASTATDPVENQANNLAATRTLAVNTEAQVAQRNRLAWLWREDFSALTECLTAWLKRTE